MNHLDKVSSWEDPRPLPYGWERKYDSRKQKAYFVDHNVRKTTWTDPRPPIREDQIRQPLRSRPRVPVPQAQEEHKSLSNREVYEGILQMALADDRVTVPELELLKRMQLQFDITDRQHVEALKRIGISEQDWERMKEAGASEETQGAAVREECIICLDRVADHVILDCMHLCLCKECSASIKICPCCRQTVASIQKVYF